MSKQNRARIPAGHRSRRHTSVMGDKRQRRAKDRLRKELSR